MHHYICDACQSRSADTRHDGHERTPCRHRVVVIASTDGVHRQRSDAGHRDRGGRDSHRDEVHRDGVHRGARSGRAGRQCTTRVRQAEEHWQVLGSVLELELERVPGSALGH